MGPLKIVHEDILADLDPTQYTIILHGCNCKHIMGAGIAKYLRSKFPAIYAADKQTLHGDRSKLGTYSYVTIFPDPMVRDARIWVFNCYTQFDIGRDTAGNPPVDYSAIATIMNNIGSKYSGWSIRAPKIGCGLAGGDWKIVEPLMFPLTIKNSLTIYQK